MRVAFMGSKALGVSVLAAMGDVVNSEHLLVGAIAADDRTDVRTADAELRQVAERIGVPFVRVSGAAEAEAALADLAPDLVVVSGWYVRLPVERSTARFYGLHASLLPRDRGFSPVVWQIIQGRDVGLSLFELTEGIDEGDVVAQATVPLGPDDTVADVLRGLEVESIRLVREHLPGLLDGTATLVPQDHSRASYCGPRLPEDGLIDWRWPARRVHDFVRAQTRPYPGAFTALPDGRTIRIWRTGLDPRPYVAVPGRVAERRADAVLVGCGDGVIRILDAQVEGQSAQPVGQVLPSLSLRLGAATVSQPSS